MKVPPKILKHRVQPVLAKAVADNEPITEETPVHQEMDTAAKPMPISNPLNKPLPESVPKPAWKPTGKIELKPQPAAVKLKPTPAPVKKESPDMVSPQAAEDIADSKVQTESHPEPTPVIDVTEKKPAPESIEKPAVEDSETIHEVEVTPVAAPTATKGRAKKPVSRPQSTFKASDSKESALAQRIAKETHLQKTPDSLPVLEAFQEFLDSEQRRMRKRMIAISTFFTITIIVLLGGAAAAAFLLLKPMKKDVDGIRSAIANLEQTSSRSTESTSATIAKLNSMIEAEREQMRESTTDIETKVTGYGDDLTAVRDHLATLQSENSELKVQLGTLKKDLPNVTYKVASLMNEIDKLRGERQTTQAVLQQEQSQVMEPSIPEPESIAEKKPTSGFSAMISFVPKGKEKRVLCLLPIPE